MSRLALYIAVWFVMVVATLVEVAAVNFPAALVVVVLSVIILAAFKAVLIALYYQHLRYESLALGAIPLTALFMLIVLLMSALHGV